MVMAAMESMGVMAMENMDMVSMATESTDITAHMDSMAAMPTHIMVARKTTALRNK